MVGKVTVERTERLRRLCKSIVDDPHSIDGDTKAKLQTAALKYAATQYVDTTQALKNLYHDESELGCLVRKAVEVVADHDAPDDPIRAPVSDHPVSRLADLLVEAGSHPDRAAALHHLLHKPSGQALLARMSKAAEKESSMDTVHSIMKAGGIAGVCAAIVAKGTTTITEHELVEAATAVASERHPDMSPAQAFSKIFTASTEEARVLQNAISIAKAAAFQVFYGPSMQPAQIGGEDVNPDHVNEALAKLAEIGTKKWPHEKPDVQFARAFESEPALARAAHVRPSAPAGGAYAWPR